ncbi:MAG: AAA family ATPase [Polyangiaceae bacterium]|nr:AAA family ATPase [Polyangiaceae bacterium]
MRILSLRLLAFGPFDDRELDFSGRPEALTVVYGRNEAGKSTSLRALEGLLFGIESTQDAHKHAPANLRVGGTVLTSAGETLRFVRRRGRKQTLRDDDDRALPDSLLSPLLRGVDRELFRSLYGLDQARLAAGARALMDERGALGESLFDAGSSGAGVARLLQRLRDEADALFLPTGRKPPLNHALKELADARRQARELATHHSVYQDHVAQLARTAHERDEAEAELRALELLQRRLERVVRAAPLLTARRAALSQRAALGPVVLLPEGASAERERAAIDRVTALGALASLEAQRAEKLAELEDSAGALLEIDAEDALRTLASRIAACGDERRRREVADERARDERRLEELDERAPALTPEREREVLTALAARDDAETKRAEAMARVAELEAELAARSAEAPAGEPAPAALGRMRIALAAAERAAVREPDRRELARRVRDLDLAAERGCVAVGSSLARAELATVSPPPLEEVDEWTLEHAAHRLSRERLGREADELAAARARLAKERAEILDQGAVVTEAELAAAREVRDDALLSLAELGAGAAERRSTAASLLALVHQADRLADRLRADAERASALRRVEAELARASAEEAPIRAGLEAARAAEQAIARGAAERMARVGAPALAAPDGYRSYSERLRRFLDAEAERARAHAQLVSLETEAREAGAELAAALGHAAGQALAELLGEGRALLAAAERRAAEATREAAKREDLVVALAQARARLALAAGQRDEAAASADARAAWLGLSGGAPLVRAQEVMERRRAAASVRERLAKAAEELASFAASEQSLSAYCGVVARALGREDATGEPIARAQLLMAALGRARDVASKRREAEGQLAVIVQGIERERTRLAAADAVLTTCAERAAVREVAELPAAEEQSARARALDANIEQLQAQLGVLSEGRALEDLERELAGLDATSLEEEELRLIDERARLQGERDRAVSRRGGIERALPMFEESKAVGPTERAELLLTKARGLARRYAMLRLAAAVLEREIDAYRQLHQGPVLTRAEELVRRLTGGSIERLRVVMSDKDQPELVCVRGGHEVALDGLSEGARDQLFLALRLATIERHCEGVEPLPLVLDDVLASFDDARTQATLDVLASLAPKIQVLLFTHHEHVVELARRAAAEVQVVIL